MTKLNYIDIVMIIIVILLLPILCFIDMLHDIRDYIRGYTDLDILYWERVFKEMQVGDVFYIGRIGNEKIKS